MRFYVLENPRGNQTDAITDCYLVDARYGDAPTCPVCKGFIGSRANVPPFRVELDLWNRSFGDVVFGAGDAFLVSENLKRGFQSDGLLGISKFTPVDIVKAKFRRGTPKEPVPKYFLVLPDQSKADLDDQASGMVRGESLDCPECRGASIVRHDRVVMKPGTWSGEDVFFARGLPATVIVSERFKRMCDQYGLKNCLLIDADRYAIDFHPWERGAACN